MCENVCHPADNFKVKEAAPVGVIRLAGPLDLHIHTNTQTLGCNHRATSNIYLLAAIVLYTQEELFNQSCKAN